ncbi:MAG: hypothetical protein HLUCCA05_03900 [Roseibaca calidilacus]|uniref:Lipoprotein n=1 Tax=Roseibaca calidilacus TaxID=1666912 RepID=A0A0P7Z2A9_9RHOB|nr:hypothetical protein [Roseibaca calidilacus]KPP95821.1 MAG: hypothetical protein HLUCCA05_03900 [Roseibaca calidilacus]CUX81652.1 hypothetical protein Ga0058931_1895 [Roseibaca calidilacus]
MQKPALAALVLVLALGACGSGGWSRLNPMTWFGSDSEETIAPAGGWATEIDRRALVPVVRELEALRTPEGAIIRASGVTETQGWWDVELRPVNDTRPVEGALIFEFVLAGPRTQTGTGPEPSRSVSAGVKLSNAELAGVQRIVVRGAQNALSVRR